MAPTGRALSLGADSTPLLERRANPRKGYAVGENSGAGERPVRVSQAPDLAEVYETYHRKVVAYAAKLLGRDQAEDIAQEVFLKVGRSLGTLSDPAKLTSWIYAITLNTVRDHARGRAAEGARADARGDGTREGDEGAPAEAEDTISRDPEETAIRSEMVACFLDYVRRLPRHYLLVYALSEFEDLSNQEIANRLRLSLGTVKIRLHRARAVLYGELRRSCRCYRNERGELMGERRDS